ncbi:MAG: dCTP diphosphatase [Patiriisocius sp.]|jgi:dCTP diphosphatase
MKSLEDLKLKLRKFAGDRDWDQFHSPKNIAMALSVEVSELLEHFQWLTEDESKHLDAAALAEVADEIADVQNYLVRLADKLGIDILDAAAVKFVKNEAKYPADLVRGSSKKYSEYKQIKKDASLDVKPDSKPDA